MSKYWKFALAATALIATTAFAVAQMGSDHGHTSGPMAGMAAGMPERMMQMHQRMMQGEASGGHDMMQSHAGASPHAMMHGSASSAKVPNLPGQDAFGAIQEVVRILDADPKTDWSRVDIAGLREHLIDMNEVTLHAAATEKRLDNGVEILVSGEGRTLLAIKRMVPAHARELNGMRGWSTTTEDLPNGVKLTVTTNESKDVPRLQALGFTGLMVQGGHHQPHHLAMATGGLGRRH